MDAVDDGHFFSSPPGSRPAHLPRNRGRAAREERGIAAIWTVRHKSCPADTQDGIEAARSDGQLPARRWPPAAAGTQIKAGSDLQNKANRNICLLGK